jgi:hypothetical protein
MNPDERATAPARAPESLSDSLQFDRAEPLHGAPGSECASCQSPLSGNYFLFNGQAICAACAEANRIVTFQEPSSTDLVRATLYGAGAALAGTAIYFAILALSGYEIGWIAVAVGWLVGKAVHKGGRGLGGRKLQWIAVALTYFSIVGSYVPLVIKSAIENPPGKRQGARPGPELSQPPFADSAQPGGKQSPAVTSGPSLSISGLLLGLAILLGYSLVLPFLQGLSSIIGLFIIAIGLFEAWKWNRRAPVILEGPFPVSAAAENA